MSGSDDHQNDAAGASTFLLGPTGPGSSRGSCNPLWYVRGLGGIGNKGAGFALLTLPPSYSAI